MKATSFKHFRRLLASGAIILATVSQLFLQKTAHAQTNPCVPPPFGLVSWWRAESNAGHSVGTNHGTLQNGVAFAPGRTAQAFSFDGIDDFVLIPDTPLLYPRSGSFTIDAWIKTTNTTGSQFIVSRYDNGGANSCCNSASDYELAVNEGRLYGFLRDSDQGGPGAEYHGQILTGQTLVSDGAFHHIALVRDIGASQMRLYLDGRLEALAPLNAGASGDIKDDDGQSDPMLIGALSDSNKDAFEAFFRGQIDEVRFFTAALSPSELDIAGTLLEAVSPRGYNGNLFNIAITNLILSVKQPLDTNVFNLTNIVVDGPMGRLQAIGIVEI